MTLCQLLEPLMLNLNDILSRMHGCRWQSFGIFYVNTLRTGDADLRLYITTVQDGWRKSAFLTLILLMWSMLNLNDISSRMHGCRWQSFGIFYVNKAILVLMPENYEPPGNCSHCRRSDCVWKSLFSGPCIYKTWHVLSNSDVYFHLGIFTLQILTWKPR
jgi:hypothetical protein